MGAAESCVEYALWTTSAAAEATLRSSIILASRWTSWLELKQDVAWRPSRANAATGFLLYESTGRYAGGAQRGSENRELGTCENKKFCKATSHENTVYLSSCFNTWCLLVRLLSVCGHQSKSPFQKFLTLRPARATCSQCQITRRGRRCALERNRESGETRFPPVQPTCAPSENYGDAM